MTSKVNLDALIPREDFEVKAEIQSRFTNIQTLQIRDLELEGSFFYPALRKPDFQRETSDWSPEKVRDFIKSFVEGDLIPAIILWHSGTLTFTIDGAHRLSALIAWVNDDYGDSNLSQKFFEFRVPDEQRKAADQTRKLVKSTIGAYADFKHATKHPDKVKPDILQKATRLGSLALQLQWVTGDADKAEASFFKINQQAEPINKTEIKLLQTRNKPDAVAARAIMRSGTGHKYWSKFTETQQDVIENIAEDIFKVLFLPPLQTPIKTLDIPIAGPSTSGQALPLILDLVDLINGVKDSSVLSDDIDGNDTINFLKNTRDVVSRISGTDPAALGLHPAVYFYSVTGRFQPNAFMAIAVLIQEFEKKRYYNKFTEVRENLENFLVKYKMFIPQFSLNYGSGLRSYLKLTEYYWLLLNCLESKMSEKQILNTIKSSDDFRFLTKQSPDEFDAGKDFSKPVKSAAFMQQALAKAVRCGICQGYTHSQSISIDHIQRKQDGGQGSLDNAQVAHLYCNTSYKN